jgi:glycosyltransferase involved in cell wall biosynthesis
MFACGSLCLHLNDMENKLISLCIITGNAEQYIERFLTCFSPAVDEVCVVRAIGNQQPDRTLDICRDWGCKVSEYKNAPENDWPHVDNFAAARNLSASLAESKWLMWADTDDIFAQEHAQELKNMVGKLQEDIDLVMMPYEVPDDGLTHYRERIWRRGKGEWKSPIHECLKVAPDAKAARFDKIAIVHMPIGPRKAENNERNLRILETVPIEDRTPSQLFYTMQAARACDQTDKAIECAQKLVMAEDSGAAERYEGFLVMGQLEKDPATRGQLYLQAVGADPSRREAYGELALHAIAQGQMELALGWTDAMYHLPRPLKTHWNNRSKFYGWLGVQLRGMALRANMRPEEANAIESNHFLQNGAKISLLHATRGRPGQAWRARQSWLDKARNPDAIEHIYGVDPDDPMHGPFAICRHILNPRPGPVSAWNECAKVAQGEILVQMSDDFEPPMYWDEMIINAIKDTTKPKVLQVWDGHRTDELMCMAILTRARYKQKGYLFHPDFFSMYSDNWFTDEAHIDGVVIDARNSIHFQHNHPAFGKAEMDDTYARSNAPEIYEQGKKVYERLKSPYQ